MDDFGIDDELMNKDRLASEQHANEIKKVRRMSNAWISGLTKSFVSFVALQATFESQFPPVFDEELLWDQQKDLDTTKGSNHHHINMKMTSIPSLPDLFENHRMQQEKSSPTESTFEQLCSLRANDHGSRPVVFPFQSTRSTSTDPDQADDGQEEF